MAQIAMVGESYPRRVFDPEPELVVAAKVLAVPASALFITGVRTGAIQHPVAACNDQQDRDDHG